MLNSCECKHPPLVKDVIQVIWLLFQQHRNPIPLCPFSIFLLEVIANKSRHEFIIRVYNSFYDKNGLSTTIYDMRIYVLDIKGIASYL